ncbi:MULTISPECIES: hypothetical protein [unclassified Neglectibacter]|uniref:hypothetical protein n=1 Tax=unclassified Neglectibacter TaxID=2632164 RepID=UPI00191C3E80|nr:MULTISPECIES: hypothetical protein [unclassified Neglectibacter]
MSLLAIDIETFSDVDLPKCGVYAYSDSPRFEILLFAYAFDDEPTQVVDLARGEQLRDRVLAALEDETVTKTAFNAAFERTCISRYLGRQLSSASWQCTAVQSAIIFCAVNFVDHHKYVSNKRTYYGIRNMSDKHGFSVRRRFPAPCRTGR